MNKAKQHNTSTGKQYRAIFTNTQITWIYDKIRVVLVFVHDKFRNVLVMNTQGLTLNITIVRETNI